MYYSNIKYCDIANGTGVRTSLFVSGCRNHCPGCFQPETWDFHYGKPYDASAEQAILDSLKPDYIAGLTILGGDPFEKENQESVANLIKHVRSAFPGKNIWVYTGYQIEDFLPGGKRETAYTDIILSNIDVLVDGPFIQEQKNLSLKFCGSENQRMIDVPKTVREATADRKQIYCLS